MKKDEEGRGRVKSMGEEERGRGVEEMQPPFI